MGNKNELTVFESPEFGSVRIVTIDGDPWLVGKDVATALGYKNPQEAIRTHVDDEDKGVSEILTPGGKQPVPIINESGLYSLVLSSKLPTARKFRRWVTSEVVPAIHKHGAYMTSDTLDKMIASPDFGIKLLTELKTEREQRMALQAQNAALTAENELQRQTIADFEPARRYLDMILESNGSIATTQIAADYGMSAKVFNKLLRDAGIQHKVNGQWILYRKYMGKGYTDSRTIHFNHSDGRPDTKMQTYWTQKGRLFIYNALKSFNGTVPMIEREFRA